MTAIRIQTHGFASHELGFPPGHGAEAPGIRVGLSPEFSRHPSLRLLHSPAGLTEITDRCRPQPLAARPKDDLRNRLGRSSATVGASANDVDSPRRRRRVQSNHDRAGVDPRGARSHRGDGRRSGDLRRKPAPPHRADRRLDAAEPRTRPSRRAGAAARRSQDPDDPDDRLSLPGPLRRLRGMRRRRAADEALPPGGAPRGRRARHPGVSLRAPRHGRVSHRGPGGRRER